MGESSPLLSSLIEDGNYSSKIAKLVSYFSGKVLQSLYLHVLMPESNWVPQPPKGRCAIDDWCWDKPTRIKAEGPKQSLATSKNIITSWP